MKIAIVPGSFDPITRGHERLVARAAQLFDKVYVVAMLNSEKRYMLTLEQKKQLMQCALSHIPNVEVDTHSGMLFEYAMAKSACAIVKGARCGEDFEYELKMAQFNSEKYPAAQTIILPSESGFEDISSTEARKNVANEQMLSENVCKLLKSFVAK